MPDLLLYLKAIGGATITSVIIVLIIQWVLRPTGGTAGAHPRPPCTRYGHVAGLLGVGLGAVVGYLMLGFQFRWPPASALDRFLTIIFPVALLIESVAGMPQIPPGVLRLLRIMVIAASGRVLLHGSVYVSGGAGEWTRWQLGFVLALSATLLAVVWWLMLALCERTADAAVPLAIAMATASAGILVMLAGYLKGGAAAFPLAAAVVGTTAVSLRASHCAELRGILGVGIVGLFSLLFVGRFFGRLTTTTVVVVFSAPLLCWVADLPALRPRRPWQCSVLRLVLVASVLAVVLVIAKSKFDRDLGPLL